MKKYFTRTLALILVLATVFSTVIFANAFSGGQALWSFDEKTGHLTVHSDVPYNDRFQDSDFFRMRNVIKSVSFVDGVTAIEKNAFRNCFNIESIELPRTLEFIGPWAFASCSKLKSIEIPGSVAYIGTYAFSGCAALEEIVIPPKVTVVSERAFANCNALESVEIMNGKTYICDEVFSRCKALKNVTIPENANIHSQAFFWCENIENVYYCGDKDSFNDLEINTAEDRWFYFGNVYFNHPAAIYPKNVTLGSMPHKTEYKVGEELDLTGFTLSAEMSDGTTRTISDLSQMYIHGFYSSHTGEGNVIAEYYGYKFNIPYIVFEDPEGVCGKELTWILDIRNNTLTISGNGDMYDYRIEGRAPWYSHTSKIKTVRFDKGIERISLNAFLGCDEIESVYYSGTMTEWYRFVSNKDLFRETDLYINGELHKHSFSKETITRKPTCTRSGSARLSCECGDYYTEVLPVIDHTPGDWMPEGADKLIRVCTECKLILETKDKESEEIPDEETTQPDEPEQEETTLPKDEEIPDDKPEEPAEEQGVLEQITDVFEKIADIFEDLFGFISGLFKF